MKVLNKLITTILSSFLIINTSLLIFFIFKIKNVENILRYLIMLFLIFLIIYFIIKNIEIIKSKEKFLKIQIVYIIILALFTILNINLFKFYGYISNVSKTSINHTSVVISKTEDDIKNIKDSKIGIVLEEDSIENYIIPKEIIEEYDLEKTNEIIYFDTTNELIESLNNENITYAITSINYNSFLIENEINYKFIEVYKKTSTVKREISKSSKIDKPITILLLGIDSETDGLNNAASFNADTIILITFNPKTLNSTILSIPRDTYVPISCLNNRYTKITHAGLYGEQCVIKTLENLTNIKIDHFVKMNFKGLVDLVEALDGIHVDVPYAFCEQDSNRDWGKKTIYVEEGYQKLNGEQALALTRNRKNNTDVCKPKYTSGLRNDFIRNQNQQLVINSIVNGSKNIKNISQIHSILNVIEKNISTSLNTNQILSFYDIGKKFFLYKPSSDFQQLFLSGYDKNIYDEMAKLNLYNFVYYKQSLEESTNEMKINLELKDPIMIKEFSFSLDEEYKKKIIGKGIYNEAQIRTLPNFVNKNISEIISYTNSNNITLTIEKEKTDNITLNNIIKNQSLPTGYLLSKIKSIKVTVYEYIEKVTTETEIIEENENELLE